VIDDTGLAGIKGEFFFYQKKSNLGGTIRVAGKKNMMAKEK